MAHLFEPLIVGGVRLPNRIAVSPMCTYSSPGEGLAADFHLVHLGALAMGGAGLVVQEATGVVPEGRITPRCLGIWSDEHVQGLSRIVGAIHTAGAAAGIQLAHAGRKASTWPFGSSVGTMPAERGGWEPVGPSAVSFGPGHLVPQVLDASGVAAVVRSFQEAASRAVRAGYDVVEIHAAHGYLLHQFLSPLSNRREDNYGGSFAARTRLVMEVVRAVREVVPAQKALMIRVSATDWVEGGWSLEDTAMLSKVFAAEGVDLVDVSSGGMLPDAAVKFGPHYQVPFSQRVRQESGLAVGAVGMVTDPCEADRILQEDRADLVFLGRSFLKDPYWAVHAAEALGVRAAWPPSHLRGAPAGSVVRVAFGS